MERLLISLTRYPTAPDDRFADSNDIRVEQAARGSGFPAERCRQIAWGEAGGTLRSPAGGMAAVVVVMRASSGESEAPAVTILSAGKGERGENGRTGVGFFVCVPLEQGDKMEPVTREVRRLSRALCGAETLSGPRELASAEAVQ